MSDEETLARYEAALRQIGTPTHVPQHFDPTDWWQHTACKQAQTAREALRINAETLTRESFEPAPPPPPESKTPPKPKARTSATHRSAGRTVSDTSSRA